jgi:hypothetical protein
VRYPSDVPGGKKRNLSGGPYDIVQIARKIELRRRALGIPAKRLADAIGVYESGWSKKVNCRGSTFSVQEISAIAQELDAESGWPFIDDNLAAMLDVHIGRKPGRQPEVEEMPSPRVASPSARPGRRGAAGR